MTSLKGAERIILLCLCRRHVESTSKNVLGLIGRVKPEKAVIRLYKLYILERQISLVTASVLVTKSAKTKK